MQEKSLKVLEYEKILEDLSKRARSNLVKNQILNLRPYNDKEFIKNELDQTRRMVEIVRKFGNIDLFGLYDLTEIVGYIRRNGVLEPRELLKILDSLRVTEYLKDYGKNIEDEYIADIFSRLSTNDFLKKEIERSIISEEEISDNASSDLRSIRRSIERKEVEIRNKLNSYISNSKYDTALQDRVVSVRDGRYVLPVMTNKRSVIPGIVHDKSSSGNTLFIEPNAIVELNNQLKDLEIKEESEIRKILDRLSRLSQSFDVELLENQKLIARIDFLQAKSRYALEKEHSLPIIDDNKIIDLKGLRHPLLTGHVVAIDVKIGDGYTSLIITGPNTGGKTVSLKTVGLVVAMAQSGLFIPAEEGSRSYVFDDIFLDIGDTQSIEMSLSTFSASLKNIVYIINNASENSLILLDEIGSGTDPIEGAALAIAILTYLTDNKIMTFSTTHYSELKYYAMENEGVMNASVEFDIKTLSPTYKLEIGTPGKSNAFEISKRLGLDDNILNKAKSLVGEDTKNINKILEEIELDKKEIESKNLEIDSYKREIAKIKKDLEEKNKQLDAKKEEVLDNAKKEANEILKKANEKSQSMLKEAKKSKRANTSDIDRSLNKIRQAYKESKFENNDPIFKERKSKNAPDTLKVGDFVIIEGLGEKAEVIDAPDDKGNIKVQMGILKMDSNIKNVTKIKSSKNREKPQAKVYNTKKAMHISPTLDLRGQRYDEAIRNLDKYLDDCLLAGLDKVKIIHGKGTGALIKGVSELLEKDKRVDNFRFGDDKEGGYGVSIVTFI